MSSIREIPPEYVNLCPVVDDKYKVLFKLGSGRFSKVKMAIKLDTNERVALKIMNQKIVQNSSKREFESDVLSMFLREIRMCLSVKHKYVVQIIDFQVGGVYRTSNGKIKRILYYVMKMADNGQLFRLVKQSENFSQKTARSIFRQLIAGVQHMHELGISHQDIKLQNVLIDHKMNIKIADFGFSCHFLTSEFQKIHFDASNIVGTLKCNAPELTNAEQKGGYHADEVDLFACGCLLFQMVMKAAPFKSSSYSDSYYNRLIKPGDKKQFWDIFSANCCPSTEFRDLIEKLLNPNPKARLSLKQVKQHPWMQGQYPTRIEYRKDLSAKLKKVVLKIRKEQEQQIKQFFKKEKTVNDLETLKCEEIIISRQSQKQMLELIDLVRRNDTSNSDSSSNADTKEFKDLKEVRSEIEVRQCVQGNKKSEAVKLKDE